jgi:hypothetical protein
MELLLNSKIVRFADKPTLRRLNQEACDRDYNRAIVPEAIEKWPDDEVFALVPALVHEHAQGKIVAPHLRCCVKSATGQTDLGFLMLDIPFELFELLPKKETSND